MQSPSNSETLMYSIFAIVLAVVTAVLAVFEVAEILAILLNSETKRGGMVFAYQAFLMVMVGYAGVFFTVRAANCWHDRSKYRKTNASS
ncbi:hypothetical protein [Thalassospira xiamenensis]|uniref:Uncharacterized protein n=1 Tax=Thalassospira xiamenensis TaxID=220697 RepID=A0A285TSX9_9PROT|nr:hypothetical protein [Thalassospira xiamenensis]SOC26136.1 hypothetical protein SAMN05428964_10561 [Thalassospira xiamenensis]